MPQQSQELLQVKADAWDTIQEDLDDILTPVPLFEEPDARYILYRNVQEARERIKTASAILKPCPSPTCKHEWQQHYEQSLLGGASPTGWKCRLCGKWETTTGPAGLPGTDTGEKVLTGPCGRQGTRADGSPFRKQIVYPDGRIEVE